MDVTQWIKESCEHQQATTPEDFIGMTRAYYYVLTNFNSDQNWRFFNFDIVKLARLVKNNEALNLRETNVSFANGNLALGWTLIPRQINILVDVNQTVWTNMIIGQTYSAEVNRVGTVRSIDWNTK